MERTTIARFSPPSVSQPARGADDTHCMTGGCLSRSQRRASSILVLVAAILLPFPVAMLAYGSDQDDGAPQAAAAVEPHDAAALTPADLNLIEESMRVQRDAQADLQTAQLVADRAQIAAERAQLHLIATKYRILATHKLQPEEFDVELVEVPGDNGTKKREWRILRRKQASKPSP